MAPTAVFAAGERAWITSSESGRSLQECFAAYLSECFDCLVKDYPDVYDATFRGEFLKRARWSGLYR